jgi:hypothetical protein
MYRFALALVLSTQAAAAFAAGACTVTGTAFDVDGRPLRDAVVRLVDVQTGQKAFSAADANAAFVIDSPSAGSYRLDVLGPPTVVTGTKIPTRSILGMTNTFACGAGQATRQDVRVQVY